MVFKWDNNKIHQTSSTCPNSESNVEIYWRASENLVYSQLLEPVLTRLLSCNLLRWCFGECLLAFMLHFTCSGAQIHEHTFIRRLWRTIPSNQPRRLRMFRSAANIERKVWKHISIVKHRAQQFCKNTSETFRKGSSIVSMLFSERGEFF